MEELLYTQQLADNDVIVRMKALKKLKKFLHEKSEKGDLTYDGLIKIWKGLYYCMYNADKALVQEDLAENISQLIHDLEKNDQKQLFFKVALDTYGREWDGSDKFRMDKYLMLFTRTLRQCLFFLMRAGWDITEVKKASDALESSIICPFDAINTKPLGLKTYLSSIILEELAKVGKKSLPDKVLLCFIYPFFKVLAVSKQQAFRREIKENILFALMRQSDSGIAKEADLAADEKIDDEESEENEQENDDQLDEEIENFVMDPRAGGVDVWLPQLKPDYREVAKMLQDLGSIPEVTSKNRNQLYFHARQYTNLAEGIYPLRDSIALSRLKTKKKSARAKRRRGLHNRTKQSCRKEEIPEMREKNYKKRLSLLAKAENDLARKMQLAGDKMLTSSILNEENSSNVEVSEGSNSVVLGPVGKKRKREIGSTVEKNQDVTHSEKIGKKLKKKKGNCDNSPASCGPNAEQGSGNLGVSKKKKKINFEKKVKKNKRKSVAMETLDSNENALDESKENDAENIVEKAMKQKKKPKVLLESVNITESSPKECKISVLPKKRNNFEKKIKKRKFTPLLKSVISTESISEDSLKSEASKLQNVFDKSSMASTSLLEKRIKKKKVSKESSHKETEVFQTNMQDKDPWKEPLKEGETEIFLPSKKLSKMQKRKMKRNLIIKRTPKINTKGKTLQINLSQNREHELKDYHKVLRKSPGIPYSAHKRPSGSVLKNSDTPTPTRKPFKSKNFVIKYNL